MNYEVVVFGQVSVIIVFLAGSLATIGVLTTRAIQRTMRRGPSLSASDERLDQLQHSVDAIAIEVERIAEAQRFTAKLLAERNESVAPGSG